MPAALVNIKDWSIRMEQLSAEQLETMLKMKKKLEREARKAEREEKKAEREARKAAEKAEADERREAKRLAREAREAEKAAKKDKEGCLPFQLVDEFVESLGYRGLKPLYDFMNQSISSRHTIEAYDPETGSYEDVSDDWHDQMNNEWKFCSSGTALANQTAAHKLLVEKSIRVLGKADPQNALLFRDGNVLYMDGVSFRTCTIREYMEEHEHTFFKGQCQTDIPDIDFLNNSNDSLGSLLPAVYAEPLCQHLDGPNGWALMQCAGNLLIPQTSGELRWFSVWIGPKRTGKSQFGKFLKHLIPGLIAEVDFCGSFDSIKMASSIRFMQQELPDNGVIPSNKLKADSSGEPRELNIKGVRNEITTRPSIACVLGTNTFPTIAAGAAVEDRLQIISFRNSFTGYGSSELFIDSSDDDKRGFVTTALIALRDAKECGVRRPRYEITSLGSDSTNPLEKWLSDEFDRDQPAKLYTLGDLCSRFWRWVCNHSESHGGFLHRANGHGFMAWTNPAIDSLNQLLRRLACRKIENMWEIPLIPEPIKMNSEETIF